MNGQKKVILHLIIDNILFDRLFFRFEQMERYENRYLYGSLNCDKDFKYIKHTEKIIRVDSLDEWGKMVGDPQVDIIYMHGLWSDYLSAINYIHQNVVLMWFCYGMEIYENCFGWPPLLPLKIYKPNTYRFIRSTWSGRSILTNSLCYLYPNLYSSLKNCYNSILGRKDDKLIRNLSRIDLAFTPLETELCELKKKHSIIKAKSFKLGVSFVKEPLVIHENTGSILLEHSANISNNHLDIIAAIKQKKLDLQNRNIYIPLSYGNEKLAESVKEKATFEGTQIHCLMDPLPINEYQEMMSNCSHALFGMIRQSGLGNIFLCFKKGIKVFFFKDSIMYQQFKADGYDVFSIEDDLNDKSIREPLSSDQVLNNYNRYYSRFDASIGSYDEQFDKILKET